MRLIDADELNFEGQKYNKSQMKSILDFIDKQPTAYDVDKVVEQLEEVKKKNTEIALDVLQKERCFWYKQAMDKAIKIVKAGGIDERQIFV